MQKYWIKQENNPSLLLFALGWSCDQSAVSHITPDGYDVLCLYDYRELEPMGGAFFADYDRVVLVAWSFGIWASEQIFDREVKFHKTIAINGSPYPISSNYGIPPRIMDLTIRGIKNEGIEKFNRKVYGEYYDQCADRISSRDFAQQFEELVSLRDQCSGEYEVGLAWNRVYVGRKDVIFPITNLCYYWSEGTVLTDMPHYPFTDPTLIYKELQD